MITASHNAAIDNGVKIFTNKGEMIPEHLEKDITAFVNNPDFN